MTTTPPTPPSSSRTPSSARAHRTQAERRAQTRAALLDATIECLVELGYPRTSMQEICARAGVSKGAFQHHFASKSDLMASAVEHLTTRLQRRRAPEAKELPEGPDRIAAAIDLLWDSYSGTLATAAMELWIAARTDPELRSAIRPVDRALGRSTLELLTGLSGHLPEERMQTLFWLTVNLTRGLALDAELGGDPRRREQLLAEWKRIATLHFGE
ncbi:MULTISPECIES: TetR/AcrR family transcriptional regulator [Prauserella salsuginis group]|uniref:TetR/AcrR family transcriptional regulator n=1 Tax=Prauserella salsuginis TaxID=387889 RepID=A0ABW6G326_9PSEU|nr:MULTISPECIES: TetR/AcrR family transcriptional regulator [Prauserella salsuginis group]MCR3718487.1 transcriptional regulator, TetR family [Prauserella flava]MCR3733057.1 transcriptional regulator, TetR family [Prauserella salsuginis]